MVMNVSSSKAATAAGKYSRSPARSRSVCRARSQIRVWCALAITFSPAASGLSSAIARSWCPSVRSMSAKAWASPLLALALACRSR